MPRASWRQTCSRGGVVPTGELTRQPEALANFWPFGTFKFQNKDVSRKGAEGKQAIPGTEKDAHVHAHRATPRIPAEGPALSVCRAALQRRGRTDPNEITVFKMSIN